MKRKLIIGITVAVAVAVFVFGLKALNKNNTNGVRFKKETIKTGSIEALVVTTGTVNPVMTVDVGSQVSGKIEEIFVDFNSVVREGQIIAKIEQSSFLTRVQQNKANYQSAVASVEKSRVTLENDRKKFERALDLFTKNLISFEEKESAETQYYSSKADLQSSEAKLEQAKSQLDSSEVELAYTIIKSPINGVVINRNVNVGQTVAASFQAPVLFQIANDLSKMQVECSVDEADIGKIKESQRVTFTVDAFPDDNFSGTVSQVRYSPEIVQNVVTYTTIVAVENPEMKLRPGMTATVSIVVGEARNALLVPNSALRFTPQFTQEELQEMFEKLKQERQGQRGASAQTGNGGSTQGGEARSGQMGRQGTSSGSQFGMGGGLGTQRAQRKDVGRVWIEDEKGNLEFIIIRTGVTDNTYTEVVRGQLQEGQEIITGENHDDGDSERSNEAMRRGMFMMRR
ncbi:MAG: efflux RND transporter periplasmic adaptor subunit [Candidatus Aminicenantes bacterium]|jgi:HlyD family secretion protein